jgi:ATP-binding protein involved in chromosome partitioning
MQETGSKTEDMLNAIRENLKDISHIVMVMSGKGGVGKSTVVSNLALVLAQRGNKVGLMDIDIHGPNLPKMLGVDKERMKASTGNRIEPVKISDNLKLISMAFMLEGEGHAVIWRGPLKMKLIRQFLVNIEWGRLDWLIVNAPPGNGDELLSMTQLVPATSAIVITTPQKIPILDIRKSINFVKKLNIRPLGIIENMSGFLCPHCGERISLFKEGGGTKVAEEMGVPFLGSIPVDPNLVKATDYGILYVEGYPESPVLYVKKFPNSPATKAIEEIVEKINRTG